MTKLQLGTDISPKALYQLFRTTILRKKEPVTLTSFPKPPAFAVRFSLLQVCPSVLSFVIAVLFIFYVLRRYSVSLNFFGCSLCLNFDKFTDTAHLSGLFTLMVQALVISLLIVDTGAAF